MKDNYISDESFIARWVAGELSKEELIEFKKTEAYNDFELINTTSQQFTAPPINKIKSLTEVNELINFRKKTKSKQRTLFLSIAASIIVLFGIFGLLNSSKTYSTVYGEQLAIQLPDGSEVNLNAGSSLKHKRFFWSANRNLSLKGEAFFKVKKGKDFVVETSYGNITVLGTQFNIRARENSFELKCFEGAVRFNERNGTQQRILKPFDAIRIEKGAIVAQIINNSQPNWMLQKSVFNNVALKEVLEELEIQFDIQFNTTTVDTSKKFSGVFLHNSLKKALQATLTPMGIHYSISDDSKIITLK